MLTQRGVHMVVDQHMWSWKNRAAADEKRSRCKRTEGKRVIAKASLFMTGARGRQRFALDGDGNGHVELVGDVEKFLAGYALQGLSAALQVLVQLDGLLLHLGVRGFAPTKQREVPALGDPCMAILVVQSDTQQPRFPFSLLLFAFCHARNLAVRQKQRK